ncbi:hypothetical protein WJX84_008641 [Apatococcus fuscideae]|uniref:Sugar phosphate transporter domain-containing protein n=1 Tax=Apatococcus fuscideae TaxID=2026836 RepID=A0AAW1SNP4_9CHLO
MLVSSAVILLNKQILVEDGFTYPLTLSALGQFASAIAGLLAAKLGWMQLGPAPSLRFFLTRLMPVVACAAGSLYLGNLTYLSLSVAFIQILKVLTPALTLFVTLCFGVLLGDRLAPEQMLGYAVSVAGFGLYTYAKQQTYDLRRSPKKAQ